MKNIKKIIPLFYQIITGFISPFFLLVIILSLSGYAKGYGYDLGKEKDIYFTSGIIGLIIFLFIVIIGFTWSIKAYISNKKSVIIPIISYFIPFIISIIFMLFAKQIVTVH